jgi:hypothetical protein
VLEFEEETPESEWWFYRPDPPPRPTIGTGDGPEGSQDTGNGKGSGVPFGEEDDRGDGWGVGEGDEQGDGHGKGDLTYGGE